MIDDFTKIEKMIQEQIAKGMSRMSETFTNETSNSFENSSISTKDLMEQFKDIEKMTMLKEPTHGRVDEVTEDDETYVTIIDDNSEEGYACCDNCGSMRFTVEKVPVSGKNFEDLEAQRDPRGITARVFHECLNCGFLFAGVRPALPRAQRLTGYELAPITPIYEYDPEIVRKRQNWNQPHFGPKSHRSKWMR